MYLVIAKIFLIHFASFHMVSLYGLWNKTQYTLTSQNNQKKPFYCDGVWILEPTEAVESPSLETFKIQLDTALGQTCLNRVGGLGGLQRSPSKLSSSVTAKNVISCWSLNCHEFETAEKTRLDVKICFVLDLYYFCFKCCKKQA